MRLKVKTLQKSVEIIEARNNPSKAANAECGCEEATGRGRHAAINALSPEVTLR